MFIRNAIVNVSYDLLKCVPSKKGIIYAFKNADKIEKDYNDFKQVHNEIEKIEQLKADYNKLANLDKL